VGWWYGGRGEGGGVGMGSVRGKGGGEGRWRREGFRHFDAEEEEEGVHKCTVIVLLLCGLVDDDIDLLNTR